MQTIRVNDTGAAVEDVQQRLALIGLLPEDHVDGVFGAETAAAVNAFCTAHGLPATGEVDEKTWSTLVDASFTLGDRTLYLRMPYFHGNDVLQLQNALGALGFACGCDGIFGAHTEAALRKFQLNLALYGDGIAGAQTYRAIRNLRHSWEGKAPTKVGTNVSFARAADVLERNTLCLFGTGDFTRGVASRMSNLALATNPNSHIVSADSLLVKPGEDMLLLHIVLPDEKANEAVKATPVVQVDDDDPESLAKRFESAFAKARTMTPKRVTVRIPGTCWEDAGEARTAQHYAIMLLDAICSALAEE